MKNITATALLQSPLSRILDIALFPEQYHNDKRKQLRDQNARDHPLVDPVVHGCSGRFFRSNIIGRGKRQHTAHLMLYKE
ncbi:MAG: hypothetical protein IKI69_05600 [Oscillospiraceae bacterium]|nr:hypothetical protein [Oscillospiraceae bacterium]